MAKRFFGERTELFVGGLLLKEASRVAYPGPRQRFPLPLTGISKKAEHMESYKHMVMAASETLMG